MHIIIKWRHNFLSFNQTPLISSTASCYDFPFLFGQIVTSLLLISPLATAYTQRFLIRTTAWCVMFYCLRTSDALKKTQGNWLHEVSYLSFSNGIHIQCTQFLSQKVRGCWGLIFPLESGNPAVLSASYIITVENNLLREPSWQGSGWCQRQRRQWIISIPDCCIVDGSADLSWSP